MDAIKKIENRKNPPGRKKISVDSLVAIKRTPSQVSAACYNVPFKPAQVRGFFSRLNYSAKSAYLFAWALVIFLAFGAGMWAALATPKSEAEAEIPVPASPGIILGQARVVFPAENSLNNEVLYNTPLELLQDLFKSSAAPDALAIRKAKLAGFLKSRQSPLLAEASAIAEQEHWKLILAISFAESTLGKRCYYNNCSGIGGSQIRSYKSLKNWILAFNYLLDQRYKNQTLEQMCGVYVQPCNKNWLLATRQILEELKEQGIE